MKTLALALLCAALCGCVDRTPKPYTPMSGTRHVVERDDEDRPVRTYLVPASSIRYNLSDGSVLIPGVDHPLHNATVDRVPDGEAP